MKKTGRPGMLMFMDRYFHWLAVAGRDPAAGRLWDDAQFGRGGACGGHAVCPAGRYRCGGSSTDTDTRRQLCRVERRHAVFDRLPQGRGFPRSRAMERYCGAVHDLAGSAADLVATGEEGRCPISCSNPGCYGAGHPDGTGVRGRDARHGIYQCVGYIACGAGKATDFASSAGFRCARRFRLDCTCGYQHASRGAGGRRTGGIAGLRAATGTRSRWRGARGQRSALAVASRWPPDRPFQEWRCDSRHRDRRLVG